jgi:hypothetical protein
MTAIDRRRFATTLGAAAALPALTAVTGAPQAAAATTEHASKRPEALSWFLRYGHRADYPLLDVDFWSRSYRDLDLDRYLSPQIGRGTVWFDDWDGADELANRVDGPLAPALASILDHYPSPRTALIALDSICPLGREEWPDLLPAFRACYQNIIGYFHLERSGLNEWRQWLDAFMPDKNGRSYFDTFFRDAAALCDAVILTSPALVACDLGLTPGAPTDMLVGQQMRRLGYALLERYKRERIVGVREKGRKPRLFALGSLSAYAPKGTPFENLAKNFSWSLDRQAALVDRAFGRLGPDAQPLLITTRERRGAYKLSTIADEDPYAEAVNLSDIDAVEMIALWPFEMDV